MSCFTVSTNCEQCFKRLQKQNHFIDENKSNYCIYMFVLKPLVYYGLVAKIWNQADDHNLMVIKPWLNFLVTGSCNKIKALIHRIEQNRYLHLSFLCMSLRLVCFQIKGLGYLSCV